MLYKYGNIWGFFDPLPPPISDAGWKSHVLSDAWNDKPAHLLLVNVGRMDTKDLAVRIARPPVRGWTPPGTEL